ncbi:MULTISPECIES: ankyrin repeat domain-containing protein [Pandoraea]|uniref:ankyrin repeat domain-containing protein n=1 Tax=Pandoraea TaxID=93217 RepID=UPI001F5CF119|nr:MULTISPECIES: ankyrin repeat domain-containing protein [Pandoraea]MCI3203865.1 hypothetical protein [Pandoraea sp. LA3]MDN4581891.1 hypothetical protein [Pandoraea capi]
MERRWILIAMSVLALLTPMIAGGEMRVVDGTVNDYFGDAKEAALARAGAQGNAGEIERLVHQGANVNAVGDKNMSPLGWALAAKNVRGVKALLNSGANPNQEVGPEHEIHLVWLAAGFDSPDLLKVLLEHEGDPNARHKGLLFNAMRQAVMHPDNMKLLVDAGADVNAADAVGFGVAQIAAGLGQFDVVDYLLEHGYRRDLPLLAWELNDGPVRESLIEKRKKTLGILKSLGYEPQPGGPPKRVGMTPAK